MSDPIVPSCARVITTIQQDNGDVNQNVLHFATATDALSTTQFNALSAFVVSTWTNDLRAKITGNDRLVNVRVQDLTSVPYGTRDYPQTLLGTASDDELPKQMAGVISVHTGHAGRSGKGRIFIGSMTKAAITGAGALSSGYVAALASFGSDLITGTVSGSATFKLAVYSRKNGLAYTATEVTVDTRCDVQRRRANKRLF